jgi:hypothetical protein
MGIFTTAVLEILGVGLAVLTAIGVPLFFGVLLFDLFAERRRVAAEIHVQSEREAVATTRIQPAGLSAWDEV